MAGGGHCEFVFEVVSRRRGNGGRKDVGMEILKLWLLLTGVRVVLAMHCERCFFLRRLPGMPAPFEIVSYANLNSHSHRGFLGRLTFRHIFLW